MRVQTIAPAAGVTNSANVAGNVTFNNAVPNPTGGAVVALSSTAVLTTDTFAVRGTFPGFGGSNVASSTAPVSFNDLGTGAAGTALHGITASTSTQLNWLGVTRALGAAFSQEACLGFKGLVKQRGGGISNVAVMHDQVALALRASGGFQGAVFGQTAGATAARPQALTGSVDKYGSDSKLTLAGADVVDDSNTPVGRVILFDNTKTKLAIWQQLGPQLEAGEAVLLNRTKFSNDVQLAMAFNVVSAKRCSVGILTGISGF